MRQQSRGRDHASDPPMDVSTRCIRTPPKTHGALGSEGGGAAGPRSSRATPPLWDPKIGGGSMNWSLGLGVCLRFPLPLCPFGAPEQASGEVSFGGCPFFEGMWRSSAPEKRCAHDQRDFGGVPPPKMRRTPFLAFCPCVCPNIKGGGCLTRLCLPGRDSLRKRGHTRG